MSIDRAQLAWAAGFFDGEGSTIARADARRPGYHRLILAVPQAGRDGTPSVLVRIRSVLLSLGTIAPPSSDGTYAWRVSAREHVRLVVELLWPYLGEVKQAQAMAAIAIVDEQYRAGVYVQRAPRRPRVPVDLGAEPSSEIVERAWCAGFLDAEGCFGLNRSARRLGAADWYRIRASADQHGTPGRPAAVLLRLQATLGGRIERHGEADDHKWVVEGEQRVRRVLELTRPWLDVVKTAAAERALASYVSQVRMKGDGTRCLRGHEYDGVAMKGGRLRKTCSACDAIYDARARERRRITSIV